jgi:DNA-binding NarL/FixJ family response regulator
MKALLIDDHPLILSALQAVIEGMGENVVVTAAGAEAARQALAADSTYDLALLDLQLGETDGFELLVELRAGHPGLPVVVVSASDRTSDVMRAIKLGAMGFIPKRASNEALFDALNVVMSGGIYLPPMTLTF